MSRGIKLVLAVYFFAFLVASAALCEEHMKAEDVLKRHLDSIGTEAARAAAKSRVVEGDTSYRVLVGGAGQVDGRAFIVSDGRKLQMALKINANQYTGERFTCDGDKTSVAGTYADKSRSEFGQFLRSEDLPLREGLLGGVLTTGWPLLDLSARKARLKYLGLKKVDGANFEAVSYQPKKGTDMEITLYFDPETFRHVRTIYTATVHAGLGQGTGPAEVGGNLAAGGDVSTARQQETRYRVEERFSGFEAANGLTLPTHYDLRFQAELQNGFTKTVEWDVTTTRVLNNEPVDARNFLIH